MIVRNYQQLQSLLSWLDKQSIISYDLETAPRELDKPDQAVKPRKGQVIGIALSNGSESFYIVHQHLDFETKEFVQYLNLSSLKPVLEKLKSKKLVGFNSSFDVRFTRHYLGVDLAPALWSEAQLARHTADENLSPWEGLKAIAASLYGTEAAQQQQDMLESILANGGSQGHVWLANLDLVAKYAEQDAVLTLKVNNHYLEHVEAQGLSKFYFEDEVMPLYKNVTIDLEDGGVKLDMQKLQDTQIEIKQDIERLEAEIRSMIAPYLVDFEKWYLEKTVEVKRTGGFAQEVCKFYNAELPITKGGNYSFAAKALEKMPDSLCKRFLLGEERLPDDVVVQIQKRIVDSDNSFNLMSKAHWKIVFFETLGEQPLSRTEKKDDPMLDDEFLETVKDKYDFVPKLLDYNRLNKILSTYILRFLEKQEDGVFYPRYGQHTTISGRYSSDVQQLNRPIPERDLKEGKVSALVYKYNNLVRTFFVAQPGTVFIDCDYESLEPHVFAHVSGDEGLKDIFRKGADFYSTIAVMTEGFEDVSVFKEDPNYLGTVNPSARQRAKIYSLGAPYGQSGFALAKTLDIPVPQGEKLLKQYMNAFPKLKEWMDNSTQECITKGIIKVETGRLRRLPEAVKYYNAFGPVLLDPLKLYEKYSDSPQKYKEMKFLSSKVKNAVNNSRNVQIQGLAASIMNRSMVAIAKKFKELGWGRVVAQIHDQGIYEVPEQHAQEAAKLIQDLMENTYKISIPLKAPPAIATNFKDGH